jgi:transposase-like protein
MTAKRKQHSKQFKFKVALAAAKEDKTVNQLASEHQLHPSQVSSWKKQLLAQGPELFGRPTNGQKAQASQEGELYEQIGRLKMELEWLKKKSAQFA